MPYSQTTIHRTRVRWGRVAGLVVAIAALAAAIGDRSPASSFFADAPRTHVPRPRTTPRGLDRALADALSRATADAAYDGVTVSITSGWRSPQHQEQLLQDAISKYGSEAEARRWVATPETSPHVSGDAVDVGPSDAMTWLSEHGAAYGLCQIYGNEPWHYELRPAGCPPMYADPTYDPRMQQR